MRTPLRWLWLSILVASAAALVLFACGRDTQIAPKTTPGAADPGVGMLSLADVQPDAAPPPNARLLYLGTTVPVTVRAKHDDDRFTIDLLAHGEIFDSEEYQKTFDGFFLVNAAGEDFDPPIPLLKFPLNVGETSTWTGTLSAEIDPHKASATIATSSDSITIGQSLVETIRVQVDIVLQSIEEGDTARRRLVFWFQPKHGVVRRQFGTTSTREAVRG